MDLLNTYIALPAFALVLARVAGLTLAVPMLSSLQIPTAVKLALIVPLSLMVYPSVLPLLPEHMTLAQAAAGMAGEFIIGELVGLGAALVFLGAQIAGQIVSHQSGFSLGQVYNPLLDEENTVLDQVWYFAVLLVFMALRGHVAFVRALLDSFDRVPPLTLVGDAAPAEFFLAVLRNAFDLALRLAGPAVLALLLTSLIMGLLSRTIPQLNILSVGFTFKTAVGLIIVAVTIGLSESLLTERVLDGLDMVGGLFEELADALTARAAGGSVHAG